jgi:integrase
MPVQGIRQRSTVLASRGCSVSPTVQRDFALKRNGIGERAPTLPILSKREILERLKEQQVKNGDSKLNRRLKNMAGQIIKRGEDTWIVRIFTGRDAQGKRRYLNKTIKGKKKDAETYLSKIVTSISTGTFVEPSALSVGDYLDKWLHTAARHRVRERTFVDYSELLDRYVRPALGGKRLSDLRPLHIQSLYTELQERGLSARTVRYTHAVLSSALKQAVKWLMLAQNPASLVDVPKQARKEMQALSPEEAKRFLTESCKDRWSALFALALSTGMRPEEYLGLQWKDVDLGKGIATVQRALVWNRKGGGWSFTQPKTARSRRNIPLPSSVKSALIAHRRKQVEESRTYAVEIELR